MTVDFHDFLGRIEIHVAPCFGDGVVWVGERRVELWGRRQRPGWFVLTFKGRRLVKFEPSPFDERAAGALDDCRQVRGHLARIAGAYWLCAADGAFERVHLPPEEEPPLLAPHVARRWPSGDLVWGEAGWESEAEGAARQRLETDRTLEDLKDVPATLRAAYALAVIDRASRELGIPFSPGEVLGALDDVVRRGAAPARVALANLTRAREAAERAVRDAVRATRAAPRPPIIQPPRPQDELEGRLELSLRGAGARFLSVRRMGNELAEVTWQLEGQRLMTVMEERTLRVRDAGICLTDHYTGERGDRELTMDSLPGVVRQAIRERKLVVTRREAGYLNADDGDEED